MIKITNFNYIITIHNKEDLISQVLESIIRCCGENSHIYPVLDGCTDNSEKIIDNIKVLNKEIPITKVYTKDVNELLSINAGLKAALHEGNGYNIVLQDGVILKDYDIEKKIAKLYETEGGKLGYVSLRMGANLESGSFESKTTVPFTGQVENVCGYCDFRAKELPVGSAAYRSIPIKSPVCIPFKLINEVGIYDAELSPYGHDDVDYAIRVIDAGYFNMVYAIEFQSNLDWGGTRQEDAFVDNAIIKRNIDYIRWKHKDRMAVISTSDQSTVIKKIEPFPTMTIDDSHNMWKSKVNRYSILSKIKNKIRLHLFTVNNKVQFYYYERYKRAIAKRIDMYRFSRFNSKYDKELKFTEVVNLYKTRNETHLYFHQYYIYKLPDAIKKHRVYIEKNKKGFGEAAFHAMWWKLFEEFNPKNVLEIGVYRGQVVSLWRLISDMANKDIYIGGVSPFTCMGDSVSNYLNNIDYYKDVCKTFEELRLKLPTFVKGVTRDQISVDFISSKKWDMIYIDGGHDHDDVIFDYHLCYKNLRKGGLIIFDDASLYTEYSPPAFSFAGHPGPSFVARKYADNQMEFLGSVGHNNIYRKVLD
jgi:hypothetical protein